MSLLRVLTFLFCTAGIYVSYLIQGIVQESLSTEHFGPASERFVHMAILSWVQGLGCLTVSFLLLQFLENPKTKEYPPLWEYSSTGFSNTIGPSLGYASLENINYSAQVIIKSCKLIPTMLMGTVWYGVHYSISEWAVVALLCSGLTIFSLQASPKAILKLSAPNLLLGYTFCALNLICDGYTNSTQDNIRRKYKRGSAIHLMYATNFWLSVCSSLIFLAGELFGIQFAASEFIRFFKMDPNFRIYILEFCFCGAVGQLFIFWMIHSYGSVVTVIVTTTRKFVSILLSVFWSRTPLLPQQWMGVLLVFLGVMGNIYVKNQKHKTKAVPSINGDISLKKQS